MRSITLAGISRAVEENDNTTGPGPGQQRCANSGDIFCTEMPALVGEDKKTEKQALQLDIKRLHS